MCGSGRSDMKPFTPITSIAVPFLEDNVDTDVIFPARFLVLTQKAGLGKYVFHDRAESPLKQPRYEGASILLAGANFGCGSSREQAVWALEDAGIRCVI